MRTWPLPDGTTTAVQPTDGAKFTVSHGAYSGDYVWDGYFEKWYLTNTPMHQRVDFIPITITIENVLECECGNKNAPVGQGHSGWCKRYKKEFE